MCGSPLALNKQYSSIEIIKYLRALKNLNSGDKCRPILNKKKASVKKSMCGKLVEFAGWKPESTAFPLGIILLNDCPSEESTENNFYMFI